MTTHETTILIVDTLIWCGKGALMLVFGTFAAQALWLGRVRINGKVATKLDEPVGYLLVLGSFVGCTYFFGLAFWAGLRTWLGLS